MGMADAVDGVADMATIVVDFKKKERKKKRRKKKKKKKNASHAWAWLACVRATGSWT